MVLAGFIHQWTDRYYITEILLKVALKTISQPTNQPINIAGLTIWIFIETIRAHWIIYLRFITIVSNK
jgi:hypothetical protein